MRLDSFVEFPKSAASDELLKIDKHDSADQQAVLSDNAGFFSKSQAQCENGEETKDGSIPSPTHVPSFNNQSAEQKPNKIVPALDFHGLKSCKEETLVTTE